LSGSRFYKPPALPEVITSLKKEGSMMFSQKVNFGLLTAVLTSVFILSIWVSAEAQTKTISLSLATGGTGAVFYPLGGGMAQILSRYIPNMQVTAEVTAGSVDNIKLIRGRKADLALTLSEVASDALNGLERFKGTGPVPIRTIGGIYSSYLHLVVREGAGINSASDLKGKRISTGAPGSGVEVKIIRVLESYGIDVNKDMKRERLNYVEAAGALKDRKLDAFFIEGGLPISTVLDLAATPGITIKLLSHIDHIDKLRQKYGSCYYKLIIPKGTYRNIDYDVPVLGSGNLLICHENMDAGLVYKIIKTLLEHQPELVTAHKAASEFTLTNAVVGSPVPFHPGAIKYFKERGIEVK
jgi:TRAP transporter TAXI family solute receptor